jgi:uncharacterized membrane protein
MSMRRYSCGAVLGSFLVVIAAGTTPAFADVCILELGHLPGAPYGYPRGISADGSTVVGSCADEAFRWTQGTGMVGLGYLTEDAYQSGANAVSADGSVVVGYSATPFRSDSFLWTAASGMRSLAPNPEDHPGEARAITPDGSVVVGSSGVSAFRWTQAGGMVSLGNLPGATSSSASAVSADGLVIAGGSVLPDLAYAAWRWTQSGGFESLGLLPDGTNAQVVDVSADGSTILGWGNNGSTYVEPFLWTANEGMIGLGVFAIPWAISGDGATVVGQYFSGSTNAAFIWDQVHGARSAKTVFQHDYGLELTGWNLTSVEAMNPDGTAFAGVGLNPAGERTTWLVTVPEPAAASLLILGALLLAQGRQR